MDKDKDKVNPKSNSERDGYIDFFKGVLIIWVIHIHTVFWSGTSYIIDGARQISLLIDVATFFFISGYLTKPATFTNSVRQAAKQFKNLYINYFVLSLLLLPTLTFAFFVRKGFFPEFQQSIIFMLSVLKLEAQGDVWGVIPVYRGSVWYLWVYLSLLPVLPFLINYFNSRKSRFLILISLLVALKLTIVFSLNFNFLFSESQYIYFYAFIYLLGMNYRIEKYNISTGVLKISFIVNIFTALILFFYFDNSSLNLQGEKFPPSFKYLIYSLLLIHIFTILQRLWNYPKSANKNSINLFFEWCGKNSYIIFLIQAIVTSFPLYFAGFLSSRMPSFLAYLVILSFNISFTILFSFVYVFLKDILKNKLIFDRN